MREEREIQLRFTKEGMVYRERKQILGISEDKWLEASLIPYDNVKDMGMRFIVESIEPEIEGDVLKALNFKVKEYVDTIRPELNITQPKGGQPKDRGIIINGEFIPCGHQYEILVNTANWLISHGYITEKDVPASGKGYAVLINKKPIKAGGKAMIAAKPLNNGWYIETSFGFGQAKGHAEALVREFGKGEVSFDISGFP